MRDLLLGVLVAALGLAFTFVYAGRNTLKQIRAKDRLEVHMLVNQ
jgi:hypothetical protein